MNGMNAYHRRLRPVIVVVLMVSLLMALVVAGLVEIDKRQTRQSTGFDQGRDMRMARQALMQAEVAMGMLVLGEGRSSDLVHFGGALTVFETRRDMLPPFITRDGARIETRQALKELRAIYDQVLDLVVHDRFAEARGLLATGSAAALLDDITREVSVQLEHGDRVMARERDTLGRLLQGMVALQILGTIGCLTAYLAAWGRGLRDSRARAAARQSADRVRNESQRLFEMTDALQSAVDLADATTVLQATAEALVPDAAGALYVFDRNSDRLMLARVWGVAAAVAPAQTIVADQCWALKRGKLHKNLPDAVHLRCPHHGDGQGGSLEIPMIARGEVLGLLMLQIGTDDAVARLDAIQGVATALADATSLALANLALRDRLRVQALHDPLTGLYNRRYMEDTLRRMVHLAERERQQVAVIMIDLDHFKKLNDQFGHAKGDAVLRDAAAVVSATLRDSDVACRYGGEELIVVLPNCGLEAAAAKAERIRVGIRGLSEAGGAQVSASFGVASVPATSRSARELVAQADAALYVAKHGGRDRVARAPLLDAAEREIQSEATTETPRIESRKVTS